jgi:acyl carrier protein
MVSIEESIYDIIVKHSPAERPQLSRAAKLGDLGVESIDVIEIVFAIEETFDIDIPYDASDADRAFATVGDVIDAVENILAEQRKDDA